MPSKSIATNQPEPITDTVPRAAVCAEEWWRTPECVPLPLTDGGGTRHNASLDHRVAMAGSKDDQSDSDGGEDDDENSKDSETTGSTSTPRDESQYGESSMPHASSGNCFPQHSQLELVGHSVACATAPYPDLYYGGMMAPYGPPQLVPPQFYGMHQPRMPLPLEMAQEPVYVNAKQYHGILRRRQVRAKAELERKLIKVRKPYLHESRHQHALRRARGSGGRFAKKVDAEASNHPAGDNSEAADGEGTQSHEVHDGRRGSSTGSRDIRAAEGQSSQQWGGMSSDQAPQRALAMR